MLEIEFNYFFLMHFDKFFLRCNCDSNGKPSSAGPAYAEILVIRHGETEWNADGRIQVRFTFK